jgi:hypothetical protein
LWASVNRAYELAPHELAVLVECCRTVTGLDDLARVVAAEGVMLDGKAHPAVVESRQQRLALGRLLVTLRVPDETTGARAQHRGRLRGAYNRTDRTR